MALPSRNQTFSYESCRDLVEKLDREIDRYCAVAGSELSDPGETLLQLVEQLKDSAFNAAITAWHLCDWVFNELPVQQRQKLRFEKLADLQNYARVECRALHLCRQSATASKHWIVEQHVDPTVQTVVTAETGWTVYFLDGNTRLPAHQVFISARDFWTHFIRDNIPNSAGRNMTISASDERLFGLACGHTVVLGRLEKVETWTCEQCGKTTDLRESPYREELAHDQDTADQIDKQARARGETVVRAG